jgi:hypothetical protein
MKQRRVRGCVGKRASLPIQIIFPFHLTIEEVL